MGSRPVLKYPLNPQHFPTQHMTLLIIGGGANFVKLEDALEAASKSEIESSKCLGVSRRKLRVLLIPSLNPALALPHQLSLTQVDYALILIDPADPAALDIAEYETSLIETSFLAKKRIGFSYWKEGNGGSQMKSMKVKEFCTKFSTSIDSIRYDDEESLEYNALVLYKRVSRLVAHPLFWEHKSSHIPVPQRNPPNPDRATQAVQFYPLVALNFQKADAWWREF